VLVQFDSNSVIAIPTFATLRHPSVVTATKFYLRSDCVAGTVKAATPG
jgi:hypothetical protein